MIALSEIADRCERALQDAAFDMPFDADVCSADVCVLGMTVSMTCERGGEPTVEVWGARFATGQADEAIEVYLRDRVAVDWAAVSDMEDDIKRRSQEDYEPMMHQWGGVMFRVAEL